MKKFKFTSEWYYKNITKHWVRGKVYKNKK